MSLAVVEKKSCQKVLQYLKSVGFYDKSRKTTHRSDELVCIPLVNGAHSKLELYKVRDTLYEVEGIEFLIEECIQREISVNFPASPHQRLCVELKKLLSSGNKWEDTLINDIPRSWEKYGETIIFDGDRYLLDKVWEKVEPSLWLTICEVLQVKTIALRKQIASDKFRTPVIKIVYGTNKWVLCQDNGIKYTWNLEKNMFCSGNAPERHRIASLKCLEEVVVDMYAGIGYFTLPFLVKAKASFVHACDWNPDAIIALKKNLELNNVSDKCQIYFGDCKEVCPKNVADRVNMGLLPNCIDGWETACQALKSDTGGIVHVHENVVSGLKEQSRATYLEPSSHNFSDICTIYNVKCVECHEILTQYIKEENYCEDWCNFGNTNSFCLTKRNAVVSHDKIAIVWKKSEWKLWALHVSHCFLSTLSRIHSGYIWQVEVLNLQHVKSYAPHIDHMVLDLQCVPLKL